jgi:transposase InsO family protein
VVITPIKTTSATEIAQAVENVWIARYPRPIKCHTDQGSEFVAEFTIMCRKNSIKHTTSTSRNPQGNSLIERIHQSIGQVLRTIVSTENPRTTQEAEQVIENSLATAMHACRCATQSSLGNHSSGAIAFHRDMFLDIPLLADIIYIQKTDKQLLIDAF